MTVSLDDIAAAAERIGDLVLRTPVVGLPHPDDARLVLHCKAESLQPTGAFKVRGAYNALSLQLDEARARGVVTQSSGNHGRAVAWLAQRLGLEAVVVMPDAAPASAAPTSGTPGPASWSRSTATSTCRRTTTSG